MITTKELRRRRLGGLDDILTKIETAIIRADDGFDDRVDYSVIDLSPAIIDELIHRLRIAGYSVSREAGSGVHSNYDILRIEWQ